MISFFFRIMVIPLILFVAVVLLYSLNLDKTLVPDELYHILAARGILETGQPRIAEGLYERAFLYTLIVSKFFEWFGESPSVARVPSVISMGLLVVGLYLWLLKSAGQTAAVIGAGLLAISPFSIEVALFTRFYSLQALLFFVGVMCWVSCGNAHGWRVVLFFIGLISFVLAAYFQITTAVGFGAFAIWILVVFFFRVPEVFSTSKRTVLVILVVFFATALLFATGSGLIAKVWANYRFVPLWNASSANHFWFYVVEYLKNYPTLIPAIGLISLAGIVYKPSPAFLAASIFFGATIIASFAASKGTRYIVYAQPFFFAVIGIGLASLVEPVKHWLVSLRNGLSECLPFQKHQSVILSNFVLAGAIFLFILGNPGFARSIVRLTDYSAAVDWEPAKPVIAPLLNRMDVVVTLAELEMLYHFSDYDILFSPSRLRENGSDLADFHRDYRTGRPVIGSANGFSRVLECYESGVLVATQRRWSDPAFVPVEVKELILQNTRSVSIPVQSNILVFSWDHVTREPDVARRGSTADCSVSGSSAG